ncbi:MAG TPA: hypothetical protein VGN82_24640 [Bosea sp. (in: a-proteobacteria)]|jgi:uncharacterized FlaG/YvyC family protein|uniref:hypothetical protein n=1 Tax=Bosea sp. (in: a-proteobacteria) TaxID=1871050 RepID=UPI002E12B6FC|nr:hypothetical protein [Bosea sp. (in: a-proteobacteria)]
MDFGNAPKAAPVGGLPLVSRADIVAAHGSVSVELAPEKTVQSAQAGDAVKLDVRAQERDARARDARSRQAFEDRSAARQQQQSQRDEEIGEVFERRLVIDPSTRAVVLQKKDRETGETVFQLPDETLLKLRMYSRELTERAREAEDMNHRQIERIA